MFCVFVHELISIFIWQCTILLLPQDCVECVHVVVFACVYISVSVCVLFELYIVNVVVANCEHNCLIISQSSIVSRRRRRGR